MLLRVIEPVEQDGDARIERKVVRVPGHVIGLAVIHVSVVGGQAEWPRIGVVADWKVVTGSQRADGSGCCI